MKLFGFPIGNRDKEYKKRRNHETVRTEQPLEEYEAITTKAGNIMICNQRVVTHDGCIPVVVMKEREGGIFFLRVHSYRVGDWEMTLQEWQKTPRPATQREAEVFDEHAHSLFSSLFGDKETRGEGIGNLARTLISYHKKVNNLKVFKNGPEACYYLDEVTHHEYQTVQETEKLTIRKYKTLEEIGAEIWRYDIFRHAGTANVTLVMWVSTGIVSGTYINVGEKDLILTDFFKKKESYHIAVNPGPPL